MARVLSKLRRLNRLLKSQLLRLELFAKDTDTYGDFFGNLTIDAQSGNDININFALRDYANIALPEQRQFEMELVNLDMSQPATDATIQAGLNGLFVNTTHPSKRARMTLAADGTGTVQIRDTNPPSGAIVLFIITPDLRLGSRFTSFVVFA